MLRPVDARSKGRPRFTAAYEPTIIPMRIVKTVDVPTRSRVHPRSWMRRSATGACQKYE